MIRKMKSRRMRWAWNVARMRRKIMHLGYWWESQKDKATRKKKTWGGG
jgi:hypothetical protein